MHRIFAYFHYLLAAKNRHGIHSPFVYGFIENVLMNKSRIHLEQNNGFLINDYTFSEKSKAIIFRMCKIYSISDVCYVSSATTKTDARINTLIIMDGEPLLWQAAILSFLPAYNQNIIFVFKDIHRFKLHSSCWETVVRDNQVKMSIDLYSLGVLFFRKEFLVKQHFILRKYQRN